jgi:hypothetical protein
MKGGHPHPFFGNDMSNPTRVPMQSSVKLDPMGSRAEHVIEPVEGASWKMFHGIEV